MMIRYLKLENFRNYQEEIINFSSGTNVFWGQNGQGKTNILEAVYYLLSGKSYRVNKETELIRWGENYFRLEGHFLISQRKIAIESIYRDKRKAVKVNKVPCRRLSDYLGTVNVIFFVPDDLVMIKGGPAERRRFLDWHIAQMRPGYVNLLNSYNKTMAQKNALLKSNISTEKKMSQLELWNEQIFSLGEQIIKKRYEFTQNIKIIANEIYKSLSSDQEKMELDYLASGKKVLDEILLNYAHQLKVKMSLEIERQMVLVGPHRDDLEILLKDKKARLFASQGQQRSLVLSLKLAEMEIIKKERGEYPLLLLDDVLSELDEFRRKYLIDFIHNSAIQTLITTALGESKVESESLYRVEKGHVRREL